MALALGYGGELLPLGVCFCFAGGNCSLRQGQLLALAAFTGLAAFAVTPITSWRDLPD